jgi:hypothetical protein
MIQRPYENMTFFYRPAGLIQVTADKKRNRPESAASSVICMFIIETKKED